MSTVNRINRPQMIATVADSLPSDAIDYLPMIRQAINDTADAWRKDGWHVSDFDQDSLVSAIQNRIANRQTAEAAFYNRWPHRQQP